MRAFLLLLSFIVTFFGLIFWPVPLSYSSSLRQTPIVGVTRDWGPSVVNISTEQVVLLKQNPIWGNYGGVYDNFFDLYQRSHMGTMKTNSLGSGVVVSEDGLIATNAHVVHMASKIYVTLSDGSSHEARVIGTSASHDLALIQIAPPKPLKPVRLAKDILIGETVVAIGNPLGLQNTVTEGIISGAKRNFLFMNQSFQDLIQTDAPINPGSSGGALLNLDGELVGINLAIVQDAQGIGFAVPADKISAMLTEYYKMRKEKKVLVLNKADENKKPDIVSKI